MVFSHLPMGIPNTVIPIADKLIILFIQHLLHCLIKVIRTI